MKSDVFTLGRYARDTRTRVRRISYGLSGLHRESDENVRWLIGCEANRLLEELLDAAVLLVPLLNEDEWDLDYRQRDAKAVAKAMRDKVLLGKMANTTGRTPEEAAAFAAKAEEMGGTGG